MSAFLRRRLVDVRAREIGTDASRTRQSWGDARGMSSIATKTKLGRESLYKALTAGGNPHFKTVLCLLRSLGVRLSVTPQAPPAWRARRAC
jgi:probable addiction module antidote protein